MALEAKGYESDISLRPHLFSKLDEIPPLSSTKLEIGKNLKRR